MLGLVDDLTSAHWWIGVVLVGVLINLLSAYLKPWLDRTGSRLSVKWQNRVEKKKQENAALLDSLVVSEQRQIMYFLTEQRLRMQALSFLVMGLLCFVFAQWDTLDKFVRAGSYFFSAFYILLGVHSFAAANGIEENIKLIQSDFTEKQ